MNGVDRIFLPACHSRPPSKDPMPPYPKPPTKSRHRLVILVMLAIVLIGGVANFIFNSGNQESEEEAVEYQIVDVTIPPPPPPPPPDEEDVVPEELEELDEVEQSVAPVEMASESQESSDVDLGIEIGDMALSTGGGFAIDIPRFGRKSAGGGDGEDLLGGDMDSAPSPSSKTPPIYPASLLKNGVGGKVLVSCTIDATGKVVGTSIKSSSGHPDLDKAAINAVNRWKFKPGTKGGKKIKSVVVVPFNFEVKKS